jgi:exonuclease SbcC
MASQQATLAQSQATSALLSYLRTLLRDAGPLVTQRLIRRISHQAGEFYAELMGQTDGRLVWGEDYALRLDLGKEQRSFEQLSGGERMAAALAVRMALLRETSAVDVAFFDEPTAHLDSERRESLAERLMSVRGFSQLFVISHDDTFEQAAQSCVRVWRDADGSHVLS